MSSSTWDAMKVPELKKLLSEKGLATHGKKAELVERLMQAKEEEILGTGDGSTASIDDNILNEENLLGEEGNISSPTKSTTASSTAPDAAAGDATAPATTDATPALNKSESTAPSLPEGEEEKDKKLARAARFGLPVSAAAPASEEAKTARAKRFRLPTPETAVAGDAAKAARAIRWSNENPDLESDKKHNKIEMNTSDDPTEFGLEKTESNGNGTAAAAPPRGQVSEEEKAKLLKRAARFGIPVNNDGKQASTGGSPVDVEKLAARAKRFGVSAPADEETELKKKARLERFASK